MIDITATSIVNPPFITFEIKEDQNPISGGIIVKHSKPSGGAYHYTIPFHSCIVDIQNPLGTPFVSPAGKTEVVALNQSYSLGMYTIISEEGSSCDNTATLSGRFTNGASFPI